jgi:SAM-dependent methyltransferase
LETGLLKKEEDMSNQRPRSEFTDVDHAQSPSDYVHMLDAQRSMPFIQQYKQRVRTLLDLHPGQQVLDAGTGTGEDAQEMAKLVAPGGQILIAEGDAETQVLDSPYPEVTRRFFRFRNDGMRQPDIAHRLYALFKEAGLLDVQVEPLARLTTDYEMIRPVAHYIEGMRLAQSCGVVTAEEAEPWILYLEEAMRTGRFFHAIMWFITIGRKPG